MNDLVNRIQNLIPEMRQLAHEIEEWDSKKVAADRDYKKLKAQEALKDRAEGMAVGMIEMTVGGKENVADACYERDFAEVMSNAKKELLYVAKLESRLLEGQAQREWGVD